MVGFSGSPEVAGSASAANSSSASRAVTGPCLSVRFVVGRPDPPGDRPLGFGVSSSHRRCFSSRLGVSLSSGPFSRRLVLSRRDRHLLTSSLDVSLSIRHRPYLQQRPTISGSRPFRRRLNVSRDRFSPRLNATRGCRNSFGSRLSVSVNSSRFSNSLSGGRISLRLSVSNCHRNRLSSRSSASASAVISGHRLGSRLNVSIPRLLALGQVQHRLLTLLKTASSLAALPPTQPHRQPQQRTLHSKPQRKQGSLQSETQLQQRSTGTDSVSDPPWADPIHKGTGHSASPSALVTDSALDPDPTSALASAVVTDSASDRRPTLFVSSGSLQSKTQPQQQARRQRQQPSPASPPAGTHRQPQQRTLH